MSILLTGASAFAPCSVQKCKLRVRVVPVINSVLSLVVVQCCVVSTLRTQCTRCWICSGLLKVGRVQQLVLYYTGW